MSGIMEEHGYIPAARAAALAEVCVQTIYRWIEDGKVEGTQDAGRWYAKRESLAAHSMKARLRLEGTP